MAPIKKFPKIDALCLEARLNKQVIVHTPSSGLNHVGYLIKHGERIGVRVQGLFSRVCSTYTLQSADILSFSLEEKYVYSNGAEKET